MPIRGAKITTVSNLLLSRYEHAAGATSTATTRIEPSASNDKTIVAVVTKSSAKLTAFTLKPKVVARRGSKVISLSSFQKIEQRVTLVIRIPESQMKFVGIVTPKIELV